MTSNSSLPSVEPKVGWWKRGWRWFLQLARWKQIAIVVAILIFTGFASASSDSVNPYYDEGYRAGHAYNMDITDANFNWSPPEYCYNKALKLGPMHPGWSKGCIQGAKDSFDGK